MTQYFIDHGFAAHVIKTAPTIETFTGSIKNYTVTIETFDYGTPMGWGERVIDDGGDIRERVFIDVKVIPYFGAIDVFVFRKRRPKWLPKGVTMKSFRELLISLYPKFSDWEK